MAISPPSDIVLDVASAADPAKVRAATERLARLAADPTAAAASFSETLAATQKPASTAGKVTAALSAAGLGNARDSVASTGPHDKTKAYQKFESVLLQNFVESMLPKDSELFGDKNSAEIYRSMMAEQVADQIAKSGRLGIAKQIMASHPPMAIQPNQALAPQANQALAPQANQALAPQALQAVLPQANQALAPQALQALLPQALQARASQAILPKTES